MSSHWDDVPVVLDIDSGIAAIEREQMTKLRPMDIEGPAKSSVCPGKTQISLGICPLLCLHCVLNGKLKTQGFILRTAKTLIRLGKCPA